jgi:hephaestin
MTPARVPLGTVFVLLCLFLALADANGQPSTQENSSGKVRTYYVAADEVEWDYAPNGMNQMMGMQFDGFAKIFTEQGLHRIGKVYRKALYREYSDETFTKLKPRAPEWEHAGLLGPVMRAEVGDTIRVVFKNNATHAYSMHPHGVSYKKDSEGSSYNDGTSGNDKLDDDVPPGKTHVYLWEVPERAGPGPSDPSSIGWLYHSHSTKDVASGLIGFIIVTAQGKARPDGSPKDVNREFVSLFQLFNENSSWYLDHNIQTYTTDPKGVDKLEAKPADDQGNFSATGTGFTAANIKATINGYIYANMPMMTMKKGEHLRWYLATIGEGINFHTPHWHGNVVTQEGKHTDVVLLGGPAQMLTVDMVPDAPGIWLYHCHVDDHMDMGMAALYKVEP